MPYIGKVARLHLDPAITELETRITSAGDLNYAITRLAVLILQRGVTDYARGPNYAQMSNIHGVLADVAAEFYRRVMAPYEDMKMKENGDVYGPYHKQSDK